MPAEPVRIPDGPESPGRWKAVLCFLFMVSGWYAVTGPRVQPSQWMVQPEQPWQKHAATRPNKGARNTEFMPPEHGSAPLVEARAWLSGQMNLPDQGADPLHTRMHDTAYVAESGNVYAISPPLMTLMFVALEALLPTQVVGPVALFFIVVLPLLAVCYWSFLSIVKSPEWAAFFGFAFLASTPVYPLMVWSRTGNAGYINQLLSQTGVLLMLGDLLGKRRYWPAAIGLVIAAWSRQLMVIYALPMVALAWGSGRRGRNLAIVCSAIVIAVGMLMTLNWLKFGSPLETGYRLIYEGRSDADPMALRARQGLFSTQWIMDNLGFMIWELPRISFENFVMDISGRAEGNSMLFSTPVVLVAFASAGAWIRDRARLAFLLATLPIMAAVLMYHTPSFISFGCYRYGMDFFPVWVVIAAAALVRPRWRWWTIGCVAWSLVYFQMVTRPEGI